MLCLWYFGTLHYTYNIRSVVVVGDHQAPLSPLGVRTSRTNKAAVLVNPCPIDVKGRRTFLEPPKEALCMYAFPTLLEKKKITNNPCLQCSCLSRSLLRPEPLFFAFLFVSLSFHPSSQLPLRGPLPCFLPGVLSELSFFLLTSLCSAYHAYRVCLFLRRPSSLSLSSTPSRSLPSRPARTTDSYEVLNRTQPEERRQCLFPRG